MDNYQNMNGCYPPPRKPIKRSGFGGGMAAGILIGISTVVLLLVFILNILVLGGYLHIGASGEIYVQSTSVYDDEGIGSAVEDKLNALDSLMDLFYMEDVNSEAAETNIFKAYLASYGDKYTVYYTPEEYASILESTTGKFYGIGAVCQKNEDGTILVTEAYEDSPAYKAGVRDGDCIVKVDGTDISSMDLSSAVALIKGDKGTAVHLDIRRGAQNLKLDVVRDEIKQKTVEYKMLENQIGYVYVSQFEDVTVEQFKNAIEDLKAQNMAGLIIDIRSNPGGLLSAVTDMLEYILPDGLLVYTEDKSGNRKEYSGSDNNQLAVPYAVLVDGNSASASEIFAGAVQDYGTGRIIGTQTFGKGIVQTIRPLTDGSAVKFTIAKYYTPKGQDIHGKGVTPDMVIEGNADSETDIQLEAAIKYLTGEAAME